MTPSASRMNRFVKAASGGERPVSSLEVDAAISNPADMTLEQVEHLAQLEPYGAGNPRPVFALLGATVDSVQAVGQGKHLKLRLSKGPSRFDAIFFSMTGGPRLSWSPAAGWTQPSICRPTPSGAPPLCSCSWWTCVPL